GKYFVKGDFNSRACLYRWNGSNYDLVWQCFTGHPWVTAVGISDDGSTIMAGTFQYSPNNTGKVLLFDSSSSTPLWEYSQYGDYVASCALSEDGARVVAGSWGQLNATFGDVLTVFDRSSSTPLFQLLDDIDEPGSIFSVDIAKDGSFITAGGKAVHAREFGNGGEVYAIRMMDSLGNDVGVETINAPAAFLQVGQTITPQAVVRNYGTQTATFNTICSIEDSSAQVLYTDTFTVLNLGPGSSQTLFFSGNWTVPAYGVFRTMAFTTLTGDEFNLNDTLYSGSICYHDGAVTSILYPFNELTLNYTNAPRVSISNQGSYTENIPVNCEIYDGLGSLVYTGTSQYYLSPLQTQTVTLTPAWSPVDTGTYDAYFFTQLADDYYPSNDTMHRAVYSSTEILYDDSFLDIYGSVSSTFADNKFAEKMLPCLTAPYYVTRVRFYVSSADPIIVSLNKDSLGLPGLNPSYHVAPPETVTAIGAGWVAKEYSPPILMTNTDPFWAVIHWISTSPSAPYIGMDNTQPLDNLSYWYWTDPQNPGWHAWTPYDFMIRTMTAAEVGVSEFKNGAANRFLFCAPQPNPFTTNLKLRFSMPHSGKVAIKAYDITGRIVATVIDETLDAGAHEIIWQGIDDNQCKVSSGIYFLRVNYENENITRKVIVVAD
ncbi:MAG: T9SS type A sorting domain-containing protein, partial [candidate division WOR-3 bacterium]